MPKTSLVQAMLVSLMRFFSSSLMESLPPKSEVASSGLIWSTVFFADAATDFFSGRGIKRAFSGSFFYAGFGCRADKFGAETLGKFFFKFVFTDSLHAQSRSVQARGVRIFMRDGG